MDGVLILDTIVNTNFGWNFFTIGFIVFLGLFVIICTLGCMSEDENWNRTPILFITLTIIMIIGVFIFGILTLCFGRTEITTQYRVMIDDTVQMNEFLQHYNIIAQEGLTYIVELVP